MLKRIIKNLIPRWRPDTQIDRAKRWMGNNYGGFFIHPDALRNTSVVYSFGIGTDISFDTDIIKEYACTVHGFDPTPKSIEWMGNNLVDGLQFYPYGIYVQNGSYPMHLPLHKEHVSGSVLRTKNVGLETVDVSMKTLTTIVNELGHTRIDLLKMDIEGAEYEVLADIVRSPIPIGQIAVEFHHRFFVDGIGKTREIITLLNNSGYLVFGVSETGEEVSFIKV